MNIFQLRKSSKEMNIAVYNLGVVLFSEMPKMQYTQGTVMIMTVTDCASSFQEAVGLVITSAADGEPEIAGGVVEAK